MRLLIERFLIAVVIIGIVVLGVLTIRKFTEPADVKDFPGYTGLTAADVAPLYKRLGLAQPHTGDMLWPEIIKALNKMTDRIEALERIRKP